MHCCCVGIVLADGCARQQIDNAQTSQQPADAWSIMHDVDRSMTRSDHLQSLNEPEDVT